MQELFKVHQDFPVNLKDCAKYFLDKVQILKDPNFTPSVLDVLKCPISNLDTYETRFLVDENEEFHICDIMNNRNNERPKWLKRLGPDIFKAILFVVPCNYFNVALENNPTENELRKSFDLFEDILKNRWFTRESIFFIFLNKQDILAEKIKEGIINLYLICDRPQTILKMFSFFYFNYLISK